jgi:hypothetical protein
MASGFLVLPDGRCFARRWWAHDCVLRAIIDELAHDSAANPFRHWLLDQLPGPNDVEELGFGAWLRNSDGATILRVLDLRSVTPANQIAFCCAAKQAALVEGREEWLAQTLRELADMVECYERGEPNSDWRDVPHPEAARLGPGWDIN